MATKTPGHSTTPSKTRTATPKAVLTEKVALTVKVDSKTYVRLCTLGATRRQTNQDILNEAVQQYLDRERA
jgi:hypothetical protein